MSLLQGEVLASGLNGNEPPRPLATLPVYNKQLEHLDNQDGLTCERELSAFKAHLRSLRIAHRANNWNWALPLVDAPEEAREEFFASLTRLLERQTSTVCRVRIFALLIELSAVELAPPSASASQSIIAANDSKSGGSGSSSSSLSFGHHALRIVRDILPNVVGARELFLACVRDPLEEVLASMSMQHLISLFPLLLDILADPHFSSMLRTDPDADDIYAMMANSADVLKKVFISLLSKVSTSDGLSRPDSRSLVYSLQQCGRLLTLLAQSAETAQAIHGDGVFTVHLFQNWKLFQRLDSDERWAHDSFTFFRLIGRICRGSPEAAAYMSGGVPSQPSVLLVAALIDVFKQMPDKPNVEPAWSGQLGGGGGGNGGDDGSGGQGASAKYSTDAYNASLLYCLSSLLLNSDRAAALLKDRKEGMKTPKDYHTRLLRWLHSYEQGDFLHACLDALVLLTRNERLRSFRLMLEERNYLCNEIHRIFKRLLTLPSGKIVRAHRDALILALELLQHYSSVEKIASGLNHTLLQDYDRLSVLRALIRYRGETVLVDNDVKLAAARCLAGIGLHDLNAQVVDDLVDSIKDVPSVMAPPLNAAAARMLFVAFKMAMFEPDASTTGESSPSSSGMDNVGDLFRKEATEACSALYATLEHGIVEDRKPVRVDPVTVRYRLAMVKVLMAAWAQPEMRQSCESRSAIEVMVKALRAEQNALRWCKNRHEQLVAGGRCVDCEEELVKNNFAQPSRMLGPSDELALSHGGSGGGGSGAGVGAASGESITNVLQSIRCGRCADNPARGRSVIQETYTPLYLEQTWSGHDIRAILDTLRQLREVDLVAFRVLHQGANILEGTTYLPCVTRLLGAHSFDAWNKDLPGRSVQQCQEWERQNWAVQQRRLRRLEAQEYPIATADRSIAQVLAAMQVEHFAAHYAYREHDRAKQEFLARQAWEASIDAAALDERLVFLVVRDGAGAVVGVVAGGPLRESTYIAPVGAGDESLGAPFAEMYGLYVSSVLPEEDTKKLQQKLLSSLSSRLFSLGFRSCFARAHRSERLLFSVAKGVDIDPATQAQLAAARKKAAAASTSSSSSLIGGGSSDPGAACAAMGASVKEFLYLWRLEENVWRRTPAHDEFMSSNGLQIFLDFVLRDTIKIAQVFTSTIRESMEEFGDELQDSLHRHQEATKDGGALRVGGAGAGAGLGAGLGVSGDEEGSAGAGAGPDGKPLQRLPHSGLDYQSLLPPPLPVDAFDLGDAPLAGSGVLAVLNLKEDHLYKHLLPLMLQERMRADVREHNRAEESLWSASLLGTVQENLLTVAANYASAASVWDDSSWLVRVEKRGGKKKPGAGGRAGTVSAGEAQSVAPTPRASIDPSGLLGASGAGAAAGGVVDPSSSSSPATAAAPSSASGGGSGALESDLLKHQAEGACAAIFRACYTLVVSGSLSVRNKTAKVLAAPANFYKLRCLMASFSYGIRSSILAPVSPPYLCAMATNFMSLMEELLPAAVVGLEEGLAGLEVYEVFFLVLADLFSSLMSLLRSRNEHAKDPMHASRRLSGPEESVMAAATKLAHRLVVRTMQITLFPGGDEYGFMVRANIECRAHAVQELLLRNKPLFQAALFTFLLYDMENLPPRSEEEEEEEAALAEQEAEQEADADEDGANGSSGSAGASAESKALAAATAAAAALALPQRDSMRIHILWILASFFHVSPAIQRDFLHQYQVSLVGLDLGLRPSLLHSLLAAQQQLMARDKIYQHLVKTGALKGDEFILDHAMVDFASSSKKGFDIGGALSLTGSGDSAPGVRVLLLTNQAYYLSGPIACGEEGWAWLERLNLKKREYSDIRSLTLLYGGQGLQVARFGERASKRLGNAAPRLANIYDVYQVQQLGLAQRIVDAFSRQRKDDLGCAMTVRPDLLSLPSLQRLYVSMALPGASGMQEKLLTHITVRHKGRMVPRVLIWLQQGRGGGDGLLLVAECDLSQLARAPLPPGEMPPKDAFPSAAKFSLSGLESVDFPEESAAMVMAFPEVNLHVMFHDDAARHVWRRALKAHFIKNMDAAGNWKAAVLPSNQQARLVYATKLL